MALLQPLTGAGLHLLVSLKNKVVVLIAWHVTLAPNSSRIWFHQGRLRCRCLAEHLALAQEKIQKAHL